MATPEALAEHDFTIAAARILARREQPAERRLDAEHRQHFRGYVHGAYALRLATRLCGVDPAGEALRGCHFHMEAKLVVEVALETPAREQQSKSAADASERADRLIDGHHANCNTSDTACANRSQLWDSTARCFLPL